MQYKCSLPNSYEYDGARCFVSNSYKKEHLMLFIIIHSKSANIPHRKMSFETEAIQQRYNPDPVVKFDSKKAKRILHDALDKKFTNWNYDAAQASAKARECSKYVFN